MAESGSVGLDRPRVMANLSAGLLMRSRDRVGDSARVDADEALRTARTAFSLTPKRGTAMPFRLDILAGALTRWAEVEQDPGPLTEAVKLLERSLGATDPADLATVERLRHLGDAAALRFDLGRARPDLDLAVQSYRRAVGRSEPGDAEHALNQFNLGTMLADRAEVGDRPDAELSRDRHQAQNAWRAAASDGAAPVVIRLGAAKRWADSEMGGGGDAREPFGVAVSMLSRLSWTGLPRADRERLLADWPDVTTGSVAAALAEDPASPGGAARAVQLVEEGRSVHWQQILQLRDPAERLAAEHPAIAIRLRHIAAALRSWEHRPGPGPEVSRPRPG